MGSDARVPRYLGAAFLAVFVTSLASGILSAPLLFVDTPLTVWDRSLDLGTAVGIPYVPFELVLGLWLLVKAAGLPTAAERI